MFQPGEGRPWPEAATVIAGMSSRQREDTRGESVRVVHVADIGRARDESHELRHVRLAEPERFASMAVRAGDIVMAARGYLASSTVAPGAWVGALATANVLIVRSSGLVRPEVLLFLLSTKESRAVYEKRSGAGALMLSPRSFDELHISVPREQVQESMAAVIRLREREEALVEQLSERRGKLVNKLLLRCLANHSMA
jgi:hypothetical protein